VVRWPSRRISAWMEERRILSSVSDGDKPSLWAETKLLRATKAMTNGSACILAGVINKKYK